MVKIKMNQDSSEEGLESVLLTKSNAPYDVPLNWYWLRSTDIFDIEYGKGLPIAKLTPTGYPVFGANGIIGYYSDYTQEEERVLMTCRGATCGTINMTLPKSFVTSNSLILKPKWNANLKFVKYLFESLNKRDLISGSAQPQITVKAFSEYYLPFPPIKEQERIAEKVENLLTKIDEAEQIIVETNKAFESRRASILDKTFHGELTKHWRNKSNFPMDVDQEISDSNKEIPFILPNGWKWKFAKDLFIEFPRNGYSPKSVESPSITKTLKLGAITKGYFKPEEHKYIMEKVPEDSYLWLKKGDFLIQRSNSIEYVGTAAVYTGEDNEYIYPDLIMKGKVNEKLVQCEWLVYWVNSYYGKDYIRKNATGTAGNMPKINKTILGNMLIPIPPNDEQKEALRILKQILLKEEKVKNLIEECSSHTDLLRKQILSKAFQGKLGTNDPTEESSIELLNEIISL